MTHDPWNFEVFFDGDCPLCRKEIRLLRALDLRRRIRFTDLAEAGFSPPDGAPERAALMAEIHGRLPDGRWITGVEVFRQLYRQVGLGPVVALTRLPGISWLLDRSYDWFARNRLRITGRGGACRDGVCQPAISSSNHSTSQ